MATTKYKRLTNKEKQINKQVRKELIDQGVLPPSKPKLNRKKFAKEVIEVYKENLRSLEDIRFLYEAISWVLPSENTKNISQEQIGILKMLKIALDIKQFKKDKLDNNETTYNVVNLYEQVVKPIIDL